MRHALSVLLSALLLTACSNRQLDRPAGQADFPRFHPSPQKTAAAAQPPAPLALSARLAWPQPQAVQRVREQEKLYSFSAKNMPVRKAVQLFARAYKLNVLIDQEVSGKVNVEFHDLPFAQSMQAILGALGYHWQRKGQLITVSAWETRQFTINYIRLSRSGTGKTEAQVSSGSSTSSNGASDSTGGSGGKAGQISIEQVNKVAFWDELEAQLKSLISEQGRLVVNRIAGTVQVTDRHPRVEEMARYIDEINQAIHRQVDIEVKILEVTLNDDFSLGIDWSRLVSSAGNGRNVDFNISSIITAPAGNGNALPGVLSLTAGDTGSNGENRLTALINALSEQGEVQIVSQPHIRTLNNQSALIKVGTDRTFFRREQNTDNTTAGSNTTTTDVPQVVTEGIVLSITPQISKDGWVMMDVSPVVTRVSSVTEIRGPGGNVESTAPNLDIRQTSSLVRAFNGETVIIGGLIQTQEARTDRGVPGLQDIPLAGNLFKARYDAVVKKELIILLTPRLVDAKRPSYAMAGDMPGVSGHDKPEALR